MTVLTVIPTTLIARIKKGKRQQVQYMGDTAHAPAAKYQ
jgi:hypothetical protein